MSIVYLRLNELPIIIYAGPFIVWLIFFWLGVYLSKFSNNYQIKYIIIGIMVSIIFMFLKVNSYIIIKVEDMVSNHRRFYFQF